MFYNAHLHLLVDRKMTNTALPVMFNRKSFQLYITSSQSNLTKGRIAAANGEFNSVLQMAPMCPHVRHASFGPPESTSQTVSLSVQPFFTAHGTLSSGMPEHSYPLKIAPSHRGIWTPSNAWFLEPTRAHNPNGISIGSAVRVSSDMLWNALPSTVHLPKGDLDPI